MRTIDIKLLDGKLYTKMFLSAANNLCNNQRQVDKLNVFPVPDGDTGTNMSLTVMAATRELRKYVSVSIGEMSGILASASLRGARGNSGVILSQLLRGMAKYLKEHELCDAQVFAGALDNGVKTAYKSVMKPTEGTMLTVAREASEFANRMIIRNGDVTIDELMLGVLEAAKVSLSRTPELLKVLKQAGVVDAGGKGLVLLYEGMHLALNGKDVELLEKEEQAPTTVEPFEVIKTEDILYQYCTEFIINKFSSKTDASNFGKLISSTGDSMMVVDDDDIVKVHIHTNNPGYVLERAVKIGSLSKIKIDNMKEQHNSIIDVAQDTTADGDSFEEISRIASIPEFLEPPKKYGFVSVSTGSGIANVFRDMGVDAIIEGGQTMNPSTDDVISAIESINATNIFVLPNNKNIVMAAKQAIELSNKNVIVIETVNIAQGMSALFTFDGDIEPSENEMAIKEAITRVKCAQVTFAVRDTQIDEFKISHGDILGMIEGKINMVGKDAFEVCTELIANMIENDSEAITVFCGKEVVLEKQEELSVLLSQQYPDMEIVVLDGGQPIYYYVASVE